MNSKSLAVLFPGIGYTCDKPLLYYSGKLASFLGYEVMPVPYKGFPKKIQGDTARMQESLEIAMEQTSALLKDVSWPEYGDIVFFGKSIGTIVSARYAVEHGLRVRSVVYTPLVQTFQYLRENAIVFHGTSDPWAETDAVTHCCRELSLPLYLTPGANHSLETGEPGTDLETLSRTVERVRAFLTTGSAGFPDPSGQPFDA